MPGDGKIYFEYVKKARLKIKALEGADSLISFTAVYLQKPINAAHLLEDCRALEVEINALY